MDSWRATLKEGLEGVTATQLAMQIIAERRDKKLKKDKRDDGPKMSHRQHKTSHHSKDVKKVTGDFTFKASSCRCMIALRLHTHAATHDATARSGAPLSLMPRQRIALHPDINPKATLYLPNPT